MNTLALYDELITQEPTRAGHKNHGKDCYIAHNDKLTALLRGQYGRDNLCLKIFRPLTEKEQRHPDRFRWGRSLLTETVRVQNHFAFRGLAPRVYDIVLLCNEAYGTGLAEVTDYAVGDGKKDIKKARRIAKKYKIGLAGYKDKLKAAQKYLGYDFKWVGRWFVDWGRFHFVDPAGHEKWLRKLLRHRRRGRRGALISYQAVRELGVTGQRNEGHRKKHLRMDEVDFRGKTVLDLGCSAGYYMREAHRRGARRVVGADYKYVGLWRDVNNWLGYWNLDCLELSLPKERDQIAPLTGIEKFDIVFALAIVQHMKGGYRKWIADLCDEVLWLEGGFLSAPGFREKDLRRDFRRVEFLGYIRDEDKRDLYRCWKTPRPPAEPLPESGEERRTAAIQRGRTVQGRAMLRPETMGFLYDLAERVPDGPTIEVGAMCGSAFCCWAAARKGRGKCYAVDKVRRGDLWANIAHYNYDARIIWGDSSRAVKEVEGDLAFAFIDGDHSKRGVQRDIEAYVPRILPGGIIVFHDYTKKDPGVRKAVDAWHEQSKWVELGRVNTAIAFQRPE